MQINVSDPFDKSTSLTLSIFLFANSVRGAKASANLYSLIETAKAHKLNPEEYLTKIYRHLPNANTIEDIEKLLPWNYKPD